MITLMFLSHCKSTNESKSNFVEMNSDLLEGKTNYERHCVTCHGLKGRGDGIASVYLNPKPLNFKVPSDGWKNGNSLAGIEKTLYEGIEGTSMVSYQFLSEREIKQISYYVIYLYEN